MHIYYYYFTDSSSSEKENLPQIPHQGKDETESHTKIADNVSRLPKQTITTTTDEEDDERTTTITDEEDEERTTTIQDKQDNETVTTEKTNIDRQEIGSESGQNRQLQGLKRDSDNNSKRPLQFSEISLNRQLPCSKIECSGSGSDKQLPSLESGLSIQKRDSNRHSQESTGKGLESGSKKGSSTNRQQSKGAETSDYTLLPVCIKKEQQERLDSILTIDNSEKERRSGITNAQLLKPKSPLHRTCNYD